MDSEMKRKIRGKLVSALVKAPGYQMLVKEAKERFAMYEHYINTIKLTIAFRADIHIKYHHCDWLDDKGEVTVKVGLQPTFIIKPDYADGFLKNFKLNIAKMIIDQLLNANDFNGLERFYVIEEISVEDVTNHGDGDVWCWHHWQTMMVWSSDNVSTWFIEQECGEYWLTLPLKPDMIQCTVVYNEV